MPIAQKSIHTSPNECADVTHTQTSGFCYILRASLFHYSLSHISLLFDVLNAYCDLELTKFALLLLDSDFPLPPEDRD